MYYILGFDEQGEEAYRWSGNDKHYTYVMIEESLKQVVSMHNITSATSFRVRQSVSDVKGALLIDTHISAVRHVTKKEA